METRNAGVAEWDLDHRPLALRDLVFLLQIACSSGPAAARIMLEEIQRQTHIRSPAAHLLLSLIRVPLASPQRQREIAHERAASAAEDPDAGIDI